MRANTETPNQLALSALKNKIEADTEKKLELCVQPKSLVQIMEEAANEFKKTTGRNMTYSEMREMYG